MNIFLSCDCDHFPLPKYSIKLDTPDIIQKIAITTKVTLHPLDTSAIKIKVYRANILINKQMIVVIVFTFVRLSII